MVMACLLTYSLELGGCSRIGSSKKKEKKKTLAVRPDTLHYRHSYSLLLQSAIVSDRHIDHLVTMALEGRKITVLQVLLLPDHLSLSARVIHCA